MAVLFVTKTVSVFSANHHGRRQLRVLFVCLFVCLWFYIPVKSHGHVEMDSFPDLSFPGQADQYSVCMHTFACN